MTNPTGDALKASAAQVALSISARKEAEALAERAGIDMDDHDMFVDDLAITLARFAALSPVEQAPQPVAWRSMATAPMDGSDVLIRTKQGAISCKWDSVELEWVAGWLGVSLLHGDATGWMLAPTEAPPVESQAADPVALAHISTTDDEVIADLEVLDGTFFQPKMTPVPLYIKPQVATKPTCGPDIIDAAKDLKRIVEGIDGTMKHGTWRDDHGNRLKDTTEWVRLYNAASSAGYVLVPLEPTAAMMEAVSGDMAEQRATHIHIFSADVWAAMVRAALAAEGSAE